MFRKWFACKVKYTKQLENGALKRVSERYLFEAVTFTDAEKRVYEELEEVIRGEFMVTGIAPMNVHDIISYDDSETWHKVKVVYDNSYSDTEKVKKVSQHMLVTASSVKEAYERVTESLESVLPGGFEIPDIRLSNIVEIFPIVKDDTED